MSMDSNQLRNLVRKILKDLPYPYNPNESCWSKSAENLILGTIAQESAFGTYIQQIPSKYAKGICQIEEPTFMDTLDYLSTDKSRGWPLLNETIKIKYMVNNKNPKHKELLWNNALSICLCRVKYLRVPHSLPPSDNINALGSYWKFHYQSGGDNVPRDIARFRRNYEEYIK